MSFFLFKEKPYNLISRRVGMIYRKTGGMNLECRYPFPDVKYAVQPTPSAMYASLTRFAIIVKD